VHSIESFTDATRKSSKSLKEKKKNGQTIFSSTVLAILLKIPGLIIAVTSNLFLSLSFGAAFFPQQWQEQFPTTISPIGLGVQMFLFSTCICQVIMTIFSDFPCAMGYASRIYQISLHKSNFT
jgi:hypothetical protein